MIYPGHATTSKSPACPYLHDGTQACQVHHPKALSAVPQHPFTTGAHRLPGRSGNKPIQPILVMNVVSGEGIF